MFPSKFNSINAIRDAINAQVRPTPTLTPTPTPTPGPRRFDARSPLGAVELTVTVKRDERGWYWDAPTLGWGGGFDTVEDALAAFEYRTDFTVTR